MRAAIRSRVDTRVKNDATSLVEEAMIATNEAVARLLRDRGVACIYRTHEQPAPADMAELKPVLRSSATKSTSRFRRLRLAIRVPSSGVLSTRKAAGEEYLVSMLMIRTMKRAAYQDCCAPHFGLAVTRTRTYKPYQALSRSHGPSHGESRAFQEGPKKPRPSSAMAAIADRASVAERAAEVAARESQELKLYELLETRIGEEAQGLISGVMSSGVLRSPGRHFREGFVSFAGQG